MPERRCKNCGRETHSSGIAGKPKRIAGYCCPCYKRIVWRPRNAEAVEREREASRRWKRDHLGQPGQPKGAKRAA